jgi:hypothetical protein
VREADRFGHVESDEWGSMNMWLAAARSADAFFAQLPRGSDERIKARSRGGIEHQGGLTMHWTKWMGFALLGTLTGCTAETADAPERDGAEPAEATQELSRNALTRRQEAIVLKAVDDICGDTWCEGDHNFSFERLECSNSCRDHAGSCELTFQVFSYDTDIETGPTYTRSCRTPGFTDFASLVERLGDYYALQPAYYDELSECIGRVESELPQ